MKNILIIEKQFHLIPRGFIDASSTIITLLFKAINSKNVHNRRNLQGHLRHPGSKKNSKI